MEELSRFLFKNVVIVDKNGVTHKGYVDLYLSAADNEDTEETIGILPSPISGNGLGFNKSDIASIKLAE